MSILSDLRAKKITFATAAAEAGSWIASLIRGNALTTAAASSALSDLKQAASNAVALADSALQPIIDVGGVAVTGATNAAIVKAIGPGAALLTPAIDHAISTITDALHAEVDAEATRLRASLVPAAQPAAPAPQPAQPA